MKREFLQNLTVGDQPLPKEVIDAIMEEHGKSVEKGKLWQEKYEQAAAQHQAQLQQVRFEHLLETAVMEAGGRNLRAVSALLDLPALQQAEDPEALTKALTQLKAEHGYLFQDAATTPPPYARNTGAQVQTAAPATLAGAMRERFGKK